MKNDIGKLAPQELIILVRFVQAGMLILNARLLTFVGLLMCFSLFGWAAWKSDLNAVLAAAAFAVLAFLPLQRMQAKREIVTTGGNHEQISE